MKLKYINFILENCEVITIEGKYVGDFLVDNIHTSIYRTASNSINRMDMADTFAIEICKNANKKRTSFDMTPKGEWEEHTVFERLRDFPDITSIEFELEEDNDMDEDESNRTLVTEHYSYYLAWASEYDDEDIYSDINTLQKSYVSELGNLYLIVDADKNKTIDDFFDKDFINDEVSTNFHFEMMDICDD